MSERDMKYENTCPTCRGPICGYAVPEMSDADRATLIHAAELLEREARWWRSVAEIRKDGEGAQAVMEAKEFETTERALRDMAEPPNAMAASIAAQIEAGGSGRTD